MTDVLENNIYDTFLNFNLFNKIKKDIKSYFHFMKDTKDVSKVLSKLSQKFNYIKSFKHQGVQGLTGVLSVDNSSYKKLPLVFKLSVEIDKAVEHEFSILENLSKLREFCPHFVSSFLMTELPISRTYVYTHTLNDDSLSTDSDDLSYSQRSISESDNSSASESESSENDSDEEYTIDDVELFMNDGEYLPTNVLFMEYVSQLSFSDICRSHVRKNKSLIISQILMILSALTIAQHHCNFTHYDLHVDNILIRECEPTAMFVYKFEKEGLIVPTFGFYPVIIDMGSSYSESVENTQMKTSVSNYDNGLQPVLFDKINDLHHFLLSALYDIEYETNEFYYMSTHMLYFFRHLPVLRKKGWKQLPNNLLRNVVKRINSACQTIKLSNIDSITTSNTTEKPEKIDKEAKTLGLRSLPVWVDMDRDLIEILSYGINLPWSNQLDEELETLISKSIENIDERFDEAIKLSFIPFLKEFQKFDNMSCFEDPNDLLFVLRELVDTVYKSNDIINKNMSKQTSKYIYTQFKWRLNKEFRDMPVSLNFNNLIISCKYCISVLNKFYYQTIKLHKEIIDTAYAKTEIKTTLDMLKWFRQNSSLRVDYTPESIFYVWDSVNGKNKKLKLKDIVDEEEMNQIIKMKPLKAQQFILNKI